MSNLTNNAKISFSLFIDLILNIFTFYDSCFLFPADVLAYYCCRSCHLEKKMKLVEESCTAREEFYSITTQHNQYIDTTAIETNQEKQEIVHHYFITEAEDVESHIYESIEELSEKNSERNTGDYEENVMRNSKQDDTYNVITNIVPDHIYRFIPDSAILEYKESGERLVIINCATPERKIPKVSPEKFLSGSRLVNINISQGLEYLQLEKHCSAGRFHSFRNNNKSNMF